VTAVAFTYEDGKPLDLGGHGTLGPEDDLFGDLFTAPAVTPWKRFGSTSPLQAAMDRLADRPGNGSATRNRAKRR
jgi:hypothetical protein